MKKCHSWGQALSDVVATKGKYNGEVRVDIRNLHKNLITKDLMDENPWISSYKEIS